MGDVQNKVAIVVSKACRAREQRHLPGGKEQKLKATPTARVKFSRGAVHVIAQTVVEFAGVLAEDLQSFANHSKRRVINSDDVKLCARKSATLKEALQAFERRQGHTATKPKPPKQPKKVKAKAVTVHNKESRKRQSPAQASKTTKHSSPPPSSPSSSSLASSSSGDEQAVQPVAHRFSKKRKFNIQDSPSSDDEEEDDEEDDDSE